MYTGSMMKEHIHSKIAIVAVATILFCSCSKLAPNPLPSPEPSPVPSASGTPQGVGPGLGSDIDQPKACTLEAKICPDGSTVGRTGPNCEFSACPEAASPQVSTAPGASPILLPSNK